MTYCITPLLMRTVPWFVDVHCAVGLTYCTALDSRLDNLVFICATNVETSPISVFAEPMATPWFVTVVVNGPSCPFTMDVSAADAVLTAVAMAAERSLGTWLMDEVIDEMDVVAPPAVLKTTSPAIALTIMLLLSE